MKAALHKRTWLAILLAALIAAVLWHYTRPAPPIVELVSAQRGKVEATVNNTRSGTIKACRRAKLSAPAGGQIVRLKVKKGERVKKGQVLLELWNKDIQAQESVAREAFSTARDQEKQSCLQADLAEREAARAEKLEQKGFISHEGMDQKNAAARIARAGCDAARNATEQSRSRIKAARADLDRLVLKAPFDGVVADISGELGEYATPSPPGIPTPPSIDLIDDSCLYVSAPIDEVDASRVKLGQAVRITLDAIKGKSFKGHVRRIAPYVLELEKQARTVEVEVDFDEPPTSDKLLVGYSADVEIVYATHDNVLRIPTQALLDGKHVLYYGPEGLLEDRMVGTGLANWDETEITEGLKEGDRVVLNLDQAGAKAGARVQPEKK